MPNMPSATSILTLPASLTLSAVEGVRAMLQPHLQPGARMQLDLSAVLACDAAGLQLLWAAHRSLVQQGAGLVLASPSAAVNRAAQDLGFDLGSLTIN